MKSKKLTTKKDLQSLTSLGRASTAKKTLEVFPNHHTDREYTVTFSTDEFTTLGPVNSQPDFAMLTIAYVPGAFLLESKSLKLYLQTFRNIETFYEHVVNVILDDIVVAVRPRRCTITAAFAVRGGIAMTITSEYRRKKK